jgi:hypothetical protein
MCSEEGASGEGSGKDLMKSMIYISGGISISGLISVLSSVKVFTDWFIEM